MRYASFVIRLWLPDSRNEPEFTELRGSVEHVQSGRVIQITRPQVIPAAISELLESGPKIEKAKDSAEYSG